MVSPAALTKKQDRQTHLRLNPCCTNSPTALHAQAQSPPLERAPVECLKPSTLYLRLSNGQPWDHDQENRPLPPFSPLPLDFILFFSYGGRDTGVQSAGAASLREVWPVLPTMRWSRSVISKR